MSTKRTVANPNAEEGLQFLSTTAETIAAVTLEPTGFEDPNNVVHSYSHTDRKITISHPSGTLAWWWRGERHTVASPWTSAAHNAVAGVWYLKFLGDVTTENWSQTPWSFSDVMVATVRYQALAVNSWGLRESHGLMQWQAHENDHSAIGTRWISGLLLDPATYQINGTLDAHNTFGVLTGSVKDEDLTTSINAWPEGTYTIGYRSGVSGDWVFSTVDTFPFIYAANTIQWNQYTGATWQMTAASEDSFVNIFDYAMPVAGDSDSQKYRHFLIPGQAQFTTLAAARQEFPQNLELGTLTDMAPEFVCVNRITFQFNALGVGAKTTTGRCAIQAVDPVRGSRAAQVASSGASPSDHGGLSGLSDDDHLQYQHINGRAAQISAQTTNFTADANVETYFVDTTAGNVTATLPNPVTYPGKVFTFVVSGNNKAIFGGFTVDGLASYTIANRCLTMFSDGAEWKRADRKPVASWVTGTTYALGEMVLGFTGYLENLFVCLTPHKSTTFNADAAYWSPVALGHAEDVGIMQNYFPTSGAPGRLVYCMATETIYSSLMLGSAYTVDGLFVLSTNLGGDTRWIGVAGKYVYSKKLAETAVTVTAGDAIDLSNATGPDRCYAVIGNAAGQNAMSTTPFGASAPLEPLTVWLVGRSNENTVTLATNDAARGAYVAGNFIELGKGVVAGWKYSPQLARWLEISRNNFTI